MNIKQLFVDEDAVSPVIGVILMVAITVILAAVIGTFVLGLGDQVQDTSPQAQFTFDFEDDSDGTNDILTITHDGGDKIDSDSLNVTSDGSIADADDGSVSGSSITWTDLNGGTTTDVTAGVTEKINGSTSTDQLNDDTVRLVWQAGGDNSATIGKWTGPAA